MEEKKYKILIIDDEDLILEVAEKLLTFLGYECLKARNSEQALNEFKKANNDNKKIDAVIIDILSNDKIKTEDLLKQLKEIDNNVTVIISSGHLNHPMMLNYKDFGFDNAIRKPYGLKELQKLLLSIFK